jgi:glucose-6-phosphate isomerase
MYLSYAHCPKSDVMPAYGEDQAPPFVHYVPNWNMIDETVERFSSFEEVIVIGHGGSISGIAAIIGAFREQMTKPVTIISTVDPDYIAAVKKNIKNPASTLVIAISKSGKTTTQLEVLLQFINFPLLVITELGTPLAEIGKRMGAHFIMHPPLGGRFTALSEVALLPAALAGLPIRKIYDGAFAFYKQWNKPNLIWNAAATLFQLEEQGISEIFLPIYSSRLAGAIPYIVQLCHETYGKDGKGQTIVALEGPEWQHHSLQRFLGGPRTAAAWFISVDHSDVDLATNVPPALHSVAFGHDSLFMLNGIPLSASLSAECKATMESIKQQGIATIHASLPGITPETFGGFLAFWQLFAVYSALLRGSDAYTQPEVEAGKILSLDYRRELSHSIIRK